MSRGLLSGSVLLAAFHHKKTLHVRTARTNMTTRQSNHGSRDSLDEPRYQLVPVYVETLVRKGKDHLKAIMPHHALAYVDA